MSAEGSSSLGAELRRFHYDPDQRKVSLGVGVLFLAIAIAFPVLYTLDPVAVGVLPLFASPLLVLGSFAVFAHLFYTHRIALTLHERGFEYRGVAVPYDSVRAIRYKLVHVVGGLATYNRGLLSIRLADGREIRPTMQLESMEKVIGALVEGTHATLVDGMAAALRSGQVVVCGPFELHREGLVCKGKSIPWARAALSSSGSQEHVQLLDVDPDEGDYTKVHEAKLETVENVDALEALVESLRAEAIRSRAR